MADMFGSIMVGLIFSAISSVMFFFLCRHDWRCGCKRSAIFRATIGIVNIIIVIVYLVMIIMS